MKLKDIISIIQKDGWYQVAQKGSPIDNLNIQISEEEQCLIMVIYPKEHSIAYANKLDLK